MTVYPDVKINLGLNVLRKRADGFHDLETVFVPFCGLGDVLEVTALSAGECEDSRSAVTDSGISIEIFKAGGVGWDPRTDLTVRAWELLKADFPSLPAVHIRLVKNAPVGAGLGGGSADAAYMLSALNGMFSLGLDAPALAAYAARLGSDCAFFIYDRPMFGSGRGEVLEPFELDLEGYEIRVEIPAGVAVSTREAYSGIRPHLPEIPLREALAAPVETWKDTVVNDFEASIFPLHPQIAELKQKMYDDGAVYAAMSGSGSSVFGIFRK